MNILDVTARMKQTWPDWRQRAADVAWLQQEICKTWPDYKERAKQVEALGGNGGKI